MSEVEKLYKNAGVEKVIPDLCSNYEGDCIGCKAYIKGHKPYCTEAEYPPFTPEKQLSLIKWLVQTRPIHITFLIDKWVIEGMVRYGKRYDTFEDALSGYFNNIWQDLTEKDRTEIRSILNG